jgi:hypothetical protein
MKLKHNAGSKTEREKVAKQLAWALQNGIQEDQLQTLESLNINLPPGSIEMAARSMGIDMNRKPLSQQSLSEQRAIKKKLDDYIAGSNNDDSQELQSTKGQKRKSQFNPQSSGLK